jgi:hypothetical protein
MCCASAACSWCWKSALLAAVKNAICGTPLGLVIDGSVACKTPFGAIRHPVPDSRAEETGRQVGEAGRDTQVTFTFREWASAKTTARWIAHCLYGYPFDAQLNQCGKACACGPATYSVNGTQRAPNASDNTSSRTGKWASKARFYGTSVLKMTDQSHFVLDMFSDINTRKQCAIGAMSIGRFAVDTLIKWMSARWN